MLETKTFLCQTYLKLLRRIIETEFGIPIDTVAMSETINAQLDTAASTYSQKYFRSVESHVKGMIAALFLSLIADKPVHDNEMQLLQAAVKAVANQGIPGLL